MRLLELLTPSTVKINLESTDKEDCFEELIDLLVRAGTVPDRERALDAIYTREEMRTTGIGKGVAIPHGKDDSIPAITAAAGTSAKGIEFEAIDDKPVHLVFLVLAETKNPGPHLQTLSEISTILHRPGAYDGLIHARSNDEFLRLLEQTEDDTL
jgi:mannitol/fructose-specific phosphotransferase system IIA component (Ntr-type)